MNIIICGAGRVGFTIAKQLSEQGHSITVIDPSSEDIQKIDDALDVKAIVGKGTYPSILEKANAAETDMIIAVTRNDEINMLICQIAFSIFKIPKKIARIRSQDYLNPKFTRVYNKENLPIDVIISPEIEIAKSIQRKLEAPGALDSVPFAENKIRLLEILIRDNCKSIDIKFNELTTKNTINKHQIKKVVSVMNKDNTMVLVKKDSLGTRVIVPSNCLIRTENVLISSRVPEIFISGISTESPCLTGFSNIKKTPEIKFETTDCVANPITTANIPPATSNPDKSIP